MDAIQQHRVDCLQYKMRIRTYPQRPISSFEASLLYFYVFRGNGGPADKKFGGEQIYTDPEDPSSSYPNVVSTV